MVTRPRSPARASRSAARLPSGLKQRLDALYQEYNRTSAPQVVDPIQLVRRFTSAADREIVGFCSAGLAFGRVQSVMQSVERLLAAMGPSPAAYVRRFEPTADRAPLDVLGHRWTRGHDLVALLWVLRQMLDQAGSIEHFFLAGDDPKAPNVREGLESFSTRAMALDLSAAYGRVPDRPGVAYFFPKPSSGSACKRLNLFLRWMVRRDDLDLGVWRGIDPSRLVTPLDVHVIRLGRCLGLTRRQSAGWPMAEEITASLAQLDRADPVRYDFALCHVGMRDLCGFRRPFRDERCPLRGFCRPAARTRRASPRPSGRR